MHSPEHTNTSESSGSDTAAFPASVAVAGGFGAGVGAGTALPLAGSVLGGIALAAVIGSAASTGMYYGIQFLR